MSQTQALPIDNELFKLYIQYQLRQLQIGPPFWNDNTEKKAMETILTHCQLVDGNILRSVFNDTFEHAKQSSIPYQEASGTSDDDDFYSAQDFTNDSNQNDITDTEITFNNDERAPLDADSREETQDAASDSPDHDAYLSQQTFLGVEHMLANVAQSKRILQSRLRVVDDSLTIQYSIPTKVFLTRAKCVFNIKRQFEKQSILGQCQENLVAYRVGHFIRNDYRAFTSLKAFKNKKYYYNDLMATIKELGIAQNMNFFEYSEYCERLVESVEKAGEFILVIPEVLSNSLIRETKRHQFIKMRNELYRDCSVFKGIARFDAGMKLVVLEDSHLQQGNHEMEED